MLMSRTVADDAPLVAEWIEYDRSLDPSQRIIRRQRVRTTTAPTTRAFRAAPPARPDRAGYVVADGAATIYYGPDADVLLSDSFVGGHCFRLDASRRHDGLLGLAFEPSPER